MSQPDLKLPSEFSGLVRLFPLPNMVLFPGVVQALHLFEDRYRDMMDDALIDDALITMAVPKSDALNLARDEPEILPVVCIGKIMTHARLDDGRYNLLLAGISRATIVEEIEHKTLYRQAIVEVAETAATESVVAGDKLRHELEASFRSFVLSAPHIDEASIEPLLEQEMPLGQLVDLIGYSCGADPRQQYELLAMTDVAKRCRYVSKLLHSLAGQPAQPESGDEFPPGFSEN